MSMSHVLESGGSAKNTTSFYPGDFCWILSSGRSWDPRLDKRTECDNPGALRSQGWAEGAWLSTNLKPGGNGNNLQLPSSPGIGKVWPLGREIYFYCFLSSLIPCPARINKQAIRHGSRRNNFREEGKKAVLEGRGYEGSMRTACVMMSDRNPVLPCDCLN